MLCADKISCFRSRVFQFQSAEMLFLETRQRKREYFIVIRLINNVNSLERGEFFDNCDTIARCKAQNQIEVNSLLQQYLLRLLELFKRYSDFPLMIYKLRLVN